MLLRLICVIGCVLLLAACGGDSDSESNGDDGNDNEPTASRDGDAEGDDDDDSDNGGEPPETDAVKRYGYGPVESDEITYQPDVVLIEGGPEAIQSASDNGLTWTIDADAGGVEELEEGKVMFAAAQAAGRIVELERSGGSVVVTLAPVELGEIIRDGHIKIDEPVSLDDMTFQVIPDVPGVSEDLAPVEPGAAPGTSSLPIGEGLQVMDLTLPTIGFAAGPPPVPAGDLPPPSGGSSAKTKVGEWDITAYKTAGSVGIKADHGISGTQGLKAGLDIFLTFNGLNILADVPIANGVVGQSNFRVDGLTGIGITIAAGAAEGLSDNRQIKMEIPVELSQQIWVGEIPVTLKQKFRLLVQTAFTAKNGNLSATGLWKLDGALGFNGQTLLTPVMTEEVSIVESLSGVSVGVNGIVVAAEFRFGATIGLPVAGAGPWGSLIMSLGLTNGSSLGIVQCKQGTLVGTVKGGVGVSVSTWVNTALKQLLGAGIPEETVLGTKEFVNASAYYPVVVACQL